MKMHTLETFERNYPRPGDRDRWESYDQSEHFVYNDRGVLYHRPRAVGKLYRNGEPKHEHVDYWCDNGCNDSGNCHYITDLPEGAIVCQRCEAKAVAAGLQRSEEIVGRHVHVGGIQAVAFCCNVRSKLK